MGRPVATGKEKAAPDRIDRPGTTFADRGDAGTVEGFAVDGQAMPWSVELQAARIGTHGAIAAGEGDTALTWWTIDGRRGETPARWGGRFHDADGEGVPAVATGTFEAVHGTIGYMSGAFGTRRQP